jgi:putative tryptophan/tyrosine transport system substrate-binding protein
VDVIATYGPPATRAAKPATTTIPIVMGGMGDPLRTGLVPSLARPGGHSTGNTILGADIGGKRLQLLKEGLPILSRLAFLWHPANASNVVYCEERQVAARAVGVKLLSVEVGSLNEIDSALAAMIRERPDAFLMTADPLHQLHVGWIIAFAAKHRRPAMYQLKENGVGGGLMSYGASLPELLRRAAMYVGKILTGAKPAALPIEQPTTFELVINLKTAQALGLTIPPTLLFQADEVIR